MLSENAIFDKISYKELVTKLVDVIAANSIEFAADQAHFDETISLLKTELGPDISPSAADLVDSIYQQIGSSLLFSCCLGLKDNLAHFIDPVSRTFLDVDPEMYLRENIARQLPDYLQAQHVQEQFYRTLSPKQKEKYDEGITTYICHLETIGPKLAHYYGYLRGNQLFPHVIPGYVSDAQLSLQADAHLARIREEFLPEARRRIPGDPSFTAIVGYSMAGLFALYALTRCDLFSRCASMSGSLWYPGVEDYLKRTAPVLPPERIYLSLGDKEAKTRHPVLRSVQDITEHLRDHYRSLSIDTRWELNPGNHFTDPVSRTVRGIRAILD